MQREPQVAAWLLITEDGKWRVMRSDDGLRLGRWVAPSAKYRSSER